jgi:Lrp/AsnC family transcriptional regulator, regulator for asnA, asnC and gidA
VRARNADAIGYNERATSEARPCVVHGARRCVGLDSAGRYAKGAGVDGLKLRSDDIRIIRYLQKDPRSSVARIATQLTMAESTVRRRLNRLVKGGVVQFAAMTNPFQFGYQIWTIMQIRTHSSRARAVAQGLSTAPELYFVGVTTGSHDVFAAGVFRSNQELLDFITNRLARIPGIVYTSTSNILEVTKRTIPFGLPDGGVPSARAPRRKRAASTRPG